MDETVTKKLAELSRLELTAEEITKYTGEISDILQYFESIKQAHSANDAVIENSATRNVVRQDIPSDAHGKHTDDLVASAPESEGNYIKVKKIL